MFVDLPSGVFVRDNFCWLDFCFFCLVLFFVVENWLFEINAITLEIRFLPLTSPHSWLCFRFCDWCKLPLGQDWVLGIDLRPSHIFSELAPFLGMQWLSNNLHVCGYFWMPRIHCLVPRRGNKHFPFIYLRSHFKQRERGLKQWGRGRNSGHLPFCLHVCAKVAISNQSAGSPYY